MAPPNFVIVLTDDQGYKDRHPALTAAAGACRARIEQPWQREWAQQAPAAPTYLPR